MKQKIICTLIIVLAVCINLSYCMALSKSEWPDKNRTIGQADLLKPEKLPLKDYPLSADSHISTGAISLSSTDNQETVSYVCQYRFIAHAANSKAGRSLPKNVKPCMADAATADTPRWDSEPAFLEYITQSKDPVHYGMQNGSPLDIMIKQNPGKTIITIYINNSDFRPCSALGTRPGKLCNLYLKEFCDKICSQTKHKCVIHVYSPAGNKDYSS